MSKMNDGGATRDTPLTVFYSYAYEDEQLCKYLEKHLILLQHNGIITSWYSGLTLPGADKAQVTNERLNTASVILLLISPDFLASDYCYGIEMQRALIRQKNGEACVIPVLLRPVDWYGAPFDHLQSLPRNGTPVTEWNNLDAAFRDIATGIREVLETLVTVSNRKSLPSLPSRATLSPRSPVYSASPISSQNRNRMLKRVRAFWIKGVLEQSLQQALFIELNMHEQFDAVENPWQLIMQESNLSTRHTPARTRITQVYDDVDGELLILGEPGAGKTTLLLKLANDLLDRAESDEHHPMPVIFNLSSWTEKREPLITWLVEELHIKYQIPRKVGKAWVETDQLTLLLDGLDEVTLSQRAACIDAINTYRREHNLVSVVVCSRKVEYLTQLRRLLLNNAVMVQPLTLQQIDEYLSYIGREPYVARELLREDKEMQEILQTPLMLSIVISTYSSPNNFPNVSTQRRQHIFGTYIQKMLQRRGLVLSYTQHQTIYWLAWLAHQMVQRNQTEFYIERLQPDWLSRNALCRLLYASIRGVITAAAVGFLFGIPVGIFRGLVAGEIFGGLSGLVLGLIVGLGTMQIRKIEPAEIITISWKSIWTQMSQKPITLVIRGLIVGLCYYWLYLNQILWLPLALGSGLVMVAIVDLQNAFAKALSGQMLDERDFSRPNQGIWRSAQNASITGLMAILSTGLMLTFLIGLVGPLFLRRSLTTAFIDGAIIAMFFAAPIWVIAWLRDGGFACIQHVVLRMLLWQNKYAPLNYARFLDYAAERILLRKVGGGYIFIHRFLMEYFAELHASLNSLSKEIPKQPEDITKVLQQNHIDKHSV